MRNVPVLVHSFTKSLFDCKHPKVPDCTYQGSSWLESLLMRQFLDLQKPNKLLSKTKSLLIPISSFCLSLALQKECPHFLISPLQNPVFQRDDNLSGNTLKKSKQSSFELDKQERKLYFQKSHKLIESYQIYYMYH